MENQSLASTLKHREKTLCLDCSQNLPKKLTEVELKIIEKRLKGLSFCQLDEDGIRYATDQIIMKGAAIYGCGLPQTEGFAKIISDEFAVFILEHGYRELTTEEMLLAMRLNARGGLKYPSGVDVEVIDFYGNFMNVDFFAKVLYSYLALRNILDRKIQNHADGY